MKILFVGMYPDNYNKYRNVFFQNLIFAMADKGVDCTVISPIPITKYKYKAHKISRYYEVHSPNGNIIKVYYPRYISLSAKKIININTGIWTESLFQKSAINVAKKLKDNFDAVYGHFFLSGGLAAIKIGRIKNIPSFVANGECNYDTEIVKLFRELKQDDIDGLSGIVAVSTNNYNILRTKKIYNNIPTIVAPNSIDNNLFHPRDKMECRSILGLPKEKFIVGFVGGFIERKGDKRLLEAINNVDNVYGAFVGKGEPKPSGNKVVFCNSLEHNKVPIFLNSLDVFCLPTLNEGSCNAVVEAAACGLPIISSDLPFNDDLLTNQNSIRINPNSIKEIEDAIKKLADDSKFRKKIAKKIEIDSKDFTIDKRCKKILDFITENL